MPDSFVPPEAVNPKTQMTHTAMKEFVRNHFEEFLNRKNLDIGDVNFAPEFVDHGADVNAKTKSGWTPLMLANGVFFANAKKEFPEAAAILKKAMAERGQVAAR